jgi:hypothetical protein
MHSTAASACASVAQTLQAVLFSEDSDCNSFVSSADYFLFSLLLQLAQLGLAHHCMGVAAAPGRHLAVVPQLPHVREQR